MYSLGYKDHISWAGDVARLVDYLPRYVPGFDSENHIKPDVLIGHPSGGEVDAGRPEIQILLAIYCWAYSLFLRVFRFSSNTPLKKTKCSLANGYQ